MRRQQGTNIVGVQAWNPFHDHLSSCWNRQHLHIPYYLCCSHHLLRFCYVRVSLHISTQPTRLTICSASAFIILFIEVPLLLRICPTSSKFDELIRKISTNYMRAAAYGVMSALQYISIVSGASSLIAAAVFLMLTALCYLLAGVKGQAFVGSKTLGGQGVAQMIV